jgi:hypothetical protein
MTSAQPLPEETLTITEVAARTGLSTDTLRYYEKAGLIDRVGRSTGGQRRVCLIRLGRVRPYLVPGEFGLRSENAAHRIAVEWDGPEGPETGVYIPRRDSGSIINVLVGGRLFPGRHHHASFDVRETSQDLHIAFAGRDGATRVSVDVGMAERFQGSALFADLKQASEFFQHGSIGFSAGRSGRHLDGMELDTDSWRVEPVEVRAVHSTFFDDQDRFPPGSVTLDCALLMRDVPVTWNPLRPMPVLRAPDVLPVGDVAPPA